MKTPGFNAEASLYLQGERALPGDNVYHRSDIWDSRSALQAYI
jgi:hypothetical protein